MKKPYALPLGDRVLIRRSEAEEKSPGGIVLPEKGKEKPKEGTVLAVGPGRVLNDGSRLRPSVKAGDRVAFGAYDAREINVAGEELLVVAEGDILAILR